jgi:hypothetical protein
VQVLCKVIIVVVGVAKVFVVGVESELQVCRRQKQGQRAFEQQPKDCLHHPAVHAHCMPNIDMQLVLKHGALAAAESQRPYNRSFKNNGQQSNNSLQLLTIRKLVGRPHVMNGRYTSLQAASNITETKRTLCDRSRLQIAGVLCIP